VAYAYQGLSGERGSLFGPEKNYVSLELLIKTLNNSLNTISADILI